MSTARGAIDIVLEAARRLLEKPGSADKLRTLPVAKAERPGEGWMWVDPPPWAADLVPNSASGFYLPAQPQTADWRSYDWWDGAAALLQSRYERSREARLGPVHSYAFRLDESFQPACDHAWVNRIVLFLRRWWCMENNVPETEAFGERPAPVIHLTHDVDAVSKTVAIRLKQTAFSLYNRRFRAGARFLLGAADYWQFDIIDRLEAAHGWRSVWNFYGGRGGWLRPPKELLMDPSYRVSVPRIAAQLQNLAADGHVIGLHPRYDTWRNPATMQREKEAIEEALGSQIDTVRQHWLRFSFAQTWHAQKAAGLRHDMTLGFNDRPGFRNGAALTFVEPDSGMVVTPMVLMDSHLHDYADLNETARFAAIDRILDELKEVGGEASIIWHQRVFHPDYGWGKSYEHLLDGLKKRGFVSGTETGYCSGRTIHTSR